jgi:hypothetical protein
MALETAVSTPQLRQVPKESFLGVSQRDNAMSNETQKPAPSTPNPAPAQQNQGDRKPGSDKPVDQQK